MEYGRAAHGMRERPYSYDDVVFRAVVSDSHIPRHEFCSFSSSR